MVVEGRPEDSACIACSNIEFELKPYPSNRKTNPLGLESIRCCDICGMGQALPLRKQGELDAFYASGNYWHEQKVNDRLVWHYVTQAKERVNWLFKRHLTKGDHIQVLDIGAGYGAICDVIGQASMGRSVEYHFTEPDDLLAASIQSRNQGVKCKRISSLSDCTTTYDAIFLNHVLEHVADPISFLNLLRTLLKRNGLLYIETPNRDDEFKADVFPHTLFFSLNSMDRVVEKAGLRALRVEAFGRRGLEHHRSLFTRIRNSILSRCFNFAIRLGWPALIMATNRLLVDYRIRKNGSWIRGVYCSN